MYAHRSYLVNYLDSNYFVNFVVNNGEPIGNRLTIITEILGTHASAVRPLRTDDSPFRRQGITLAPYERVTETPCYVIRMAGVVGGDGS